MKAVSTAEPIAANLGVSAVQRHLNHIGPLEGEQPADGSTEPLGTGAPAHEATTLEAIDPGRDQPLKQIGAGLTGGQHRRKHAGALWGLTLLQG